MPPPPLKTSSLVDALCDSLRERIFDGAITSAQRLTENGIAAEYEVARPTAKAALDRLVHQGLVRRSANKSAHVPLLTCEDVNDLYFSRTCLEREVMAELARRGEVSAEARDASRRFTAAARGRESISRVVELDVLFHRRLIAAVGSPRIVRMYEAVIGEAHLCMAQVQAHHLLNPNVISREHGAILRAIEARDPGLAADRLTEHQNRARDLLVEYVRQRDGVATDATPPSSRAPVSSAGRRRRT